MIGFFAPEIALACAALALLAFDMKKALSRSQASWIAALATGLALALLAMVRPIESSEGFFALDYLSLGYGVLIIIGLGISLALSHEDETLRRHWGSYLALLLFATAGCLMLVKTRDFGYAFVCIELISMNSFILVAFERKKLAMIEGALKYFLVGAFSSAVALYGISLYYAGLGSTSFSALSNIDWSAMDSLASPAWLVMAGMLMIFVSFGFKASIVPFHFWVPDAYQSAPTPVTAYLSVVPKLATLALLSSLMSSNWTAGGEAFSRVANLNLALAVFACLTMTIGNLSALQQSDMKRMFAYSSIAQAGYMLIGVLVATPFGMSSVLFYGLSYLLMNFGAFACVFWVAKRTGSYDISSCDGLAMSHLPKALAFTIFLLSLAGIPPLVGFFAKYFVFASAIEVKWAWWVAVVGALNSVIAVYYYLRVAYRMFFVERGAYGSVIDVKVPVLSLAITLLMVGTIVLGLYPKPLLALAGGN